MLDMWAFERKSLSQEDIYGRKWFSSPSHPEIDLCLARPCPHSPRTTQNSCWKWVCVTWPPGGVCSRGWRPSRAGPISHGQLLRSRRVGEGKTWTWNDPSKQSPPWVHPQAKAPVPLTLKFSCSSLFLDLFFQLDQYIFQRGITPPPSSIQSCFSSHFLTHNLHRPPRLTFFTPPALKKSESLLCLQPSKCFPVFAHAC